MGLRAALSVALVLTWLVPGMRLFVLPEERAQAAAATELLCLSSRATVLPAVWPNEGPLARSSGAPTLADVAAPMQRAYDRQWQTDAARVAFAVVAAAVLLVSGRRAGGLSALLVIAAAILYLWAYQPNWDAYRLVLVTQSPVLWWRAVSQWSWALQAERLLAPLTVWVALLGTCGLLWRWSSGGRSRATPFVDAANLRSLLINKTRA